MYFGECIVLPYLLDKYHTDDIPCILEIISALLAPVFQFCLLLNLEGEKHKVRLDCCGAMLKKYISI